MKKLLCSEEDLKIIQENNDKGLYEEKFIPTAVIHNLHRDVRFLIGEVEQEKQAHAITKESFDNLIIRSKEIEDLLNDQVEELRKALDKAKSELQWGDADTAIERVTKLIDKSLERSK